MASFKGLIQGGIATAAKVPPANVKVALSAGSVKVKAEITPAAGTTAASLTTKMKAMPAAALGAGLVTALTALPGLAAITTGTLSVSAPVFTTKSVTVGGNATTAAAAVPSDESTSGATDVKPAMGAIATVMAAVYAAHVM